MYITCCKKNDARLSSREGATFPTAKPLLSIENKRMKISTLTAFLILVILGCESTNEFEKHEPNLEAVNLYKEAYRIALLEREHSEKVDSAMLLLEKAIQIDSMYIEPHCGIIGFATLNKDKTQAIEYCHRAQRIFVNFPEFILL